MEIDYDILAEKIVQRLNTQLISKEELWTAKQCAEHFQRSKQYFLNYIAPALEFEPVQVPTKNGGKTQPMWRAGDIINLASPPKSQGRSKRSGES